MPGLPLAVVVVNLDGGPMLDACLDAVSAEEPAHLVVVDNGSREGELARLAARPGVVLVRLGQNRGFAGPANEGARRALAETSAAYVSFVNNDCVLAPGYLSLCVSALERDAAASAAQGVILDGEGRSVDGCGISWTPRGEAVQLLQGAPPPPPDAAPFAVPGVSATAAVFRAAPFLSSGGFEESFFAYYEDADLALRLSRRGARFLCVPAARARHLGSMTGKRTPFARWFHLFGNRIRTLRRNLAPRARRASAILPSALRDAASELGWPAALMAAARALFDSVRERRRDREVATAFPLLAKLPT